MKKVSDAYAYIAGICILALSAVIRVVSYPFATSDYIYFVAKWFDTLAAQQWLLAFHTPFSDYAPLYLYFIKFLTLFPVYSLYSTKTLSFIFDCIMVAYGVLVVQKIRTLSRAYLFLVATILISIPTVVLNDSLWGQSDILYAAPVLISLYYLLAGALWPAAIAMGIAFSFKLQAIFFLPIFIGIALRYHRGWRYIAAIPVLYVLSLTPAWLGGASFADLVFTYVRQSAEYSGLSLWAPSIFGFVGTTFLSQSAQDTLAGMGIAFSTIAGIMIALQLKRAEQLSRRYMLLASVFTVTLIPFLLPHMHERYFFLADILSVVYACADPRRWYLPVFIVLASLLSYFHYLSQYVPLFQQFLFDEHYMSILMLVALAGAYLALRDLLHATRGQPDIRARSDTL